MSLIIYIVIGIILWPFITIKLIKDIECDYDSSSLLMETALGLLYAVLWPMSLAVLGMSYVIRRILKKED